MIYTVEKPDLEVDYVITKEDAPCLKEIRIWCGSLDEWIVVGTLTEKSMKAISNLVETDIDKRAK